MNIDLTLEQLQELNQIRNLLTCNDLETQVVAFNLFINSSVYTDYLRESEYKQNSGKFIPVEWFVKKTFENIRLFKDNPDGLYNLSGLILPIITSILLHENKFRSIIYFNTNVNRILRNHNIVLSDNSSLDKLIVQHE